MPYEWIKALHIIAVIAWMAGMLYLPRLFVYHCEAEAGSKQSETFKTMERRLERALVFRRLAARQAAAGAAAVGRPRLFCPLRQGFRRRPQPEKPEILSV